MKKSEKLKGKEKVAARQAAVQTGRNRGGCGDYRRLYSRLYRSLHPAVVAAVGDTVNVTYTGMFDNKTVFDTNVNGTPLTFTVGAGQMIPGFDAAVRGMKVNEEKTVTIPADQAYVL